MQREGEAEPPGPADTAAAAESQRQTQEDPAAAEAKRQSRAPVLGCDSSPRADPTAADAALACSKKDCPLCATGAASDASLPANYRGSGSRESPTVRLKRA